MPTPARILRTYVDDRPGARRHLTTRELDREDLILDTARALMARFGRASLTFNNLAIALRLSPATVRRHFSDLDAILYTLLTRHLRTLFDAVNAVPPGTPHRQAAQRAAYVEASRTAFSAPTEHHTLWMRDRHTLPPDLFDCLEKSREMLGKTLGNEHDETVLSLLDNPFIQIAQIESMFATLANPKPIKIRTIKYQKPSKLLAPANDPQSPMYPPILQPRAGPSPPLY